MKRSAPPIWNPFIRGYLEDPYSSLRMFREQNPIHKGINGQWMLFKYEDVKFVLSDARFKTLSVSDLIRGASLHLSGSNNLDQLTEISAKWLLFLDPPEHGVIRTVVSKAWKSFDLEDAVRGIVERVTEDLASKNNPDIVLDFAIPIPPQVMCKLLGFPVADHAKLRKWSAAFGRVIEQFETLETLIECNNMAKEFYRYAIQAIENKTHAPENDLISKIIIENQKLEDPLGVGEIISVISLLVLAGNETLINLLGQSVLQLLSHPGQLKIWSEDHSITPKAIDELIRYISPAQFTTRVPTEDIEIRGHKLKKGERVMASMASANRDPDIFDQPDKLDLSRQNNPHVGFGHGFHFCLGAAMAKTEIGIAIPALLERFPNIMLAHSRELTWEAKFNTRGLRSLPVDLD